MDDSEKTRPGIFCPHGNYPDRCPICLERSIVESAIETQASAALEFRINEVRDQITFLERQDGHEMTNADLELSQTLSNKKEQRVTFVFKLNGEKAKEYFEYPTFYHFMNEPFHKPPRYEIDRVYCNSDDPEDIMTAETIFQYVNGSWKKTDLLSS